MIDIALAIDILTPKAQYRGSVTSNMKREYDAILWVDNRKKPTWEELQTSWDIYEAKKLGDEVIAQTKTTNKAQTISDTFPSWVVVNNSIDAISNLAEAKIFIKKLARIVYWLTKDTEV